MTGDQRSTFRRAHERLVEAVEAGATLADVEPELEHVPVSRGARDALWLLAWHAFERRERHHPGSRGAALSMTSPQ